MPASELSELSELSEKQSCKDYEAELFNTCQHQSYLRNRVAGIMKRMKTEFVDLSGDLVGEILCRLDAETLSNCCSVCKTWCQVTSNPSFAHLRRQFMLKNSKLVVVDRWRPNITCNGRPAFGFTMYMDGWMQGASKRDSLVTLRTLQSNEVGSYPNRLENDDRIFLYWSRITCDMVLYYDSQTAYLLNPRTGGLHILPGYYSPTCIDLHQIQYTYGYDASKAEYVLVANEWVDEQHERVAKSSFAVGQTCSGWKIIWDAAFPRKAMTCLGIILNNRAYWPSIENLPCSKGKEIIVSMDLDHSDSNDAFCIIKSPPFIPEIGLCFADHHISLIDYKGSLGMVDTKHMASTNTLLLWLLKDDRSSLWIKKFHINLGRILSAIHPKFTLSWHETVCLKSSKEGELMLCPDRHGHNYRRGRNERSYYILNPETQTAEHLIVPCPRHPRCLDCCDSTLLGAAFL